MCDLLKKGQLKLLFNLLKRRDWTEFFQPWFDVVIIDLRVTFILLYALTWPYTATPVSYKEERFPTLLFCHFLEVYSNIQFNLIWITLKKIFEKTNIEISLPELCFLLLSSPINNLTVPQIYLVSVWKEPTCRLGTILDKLNIKELKLALPQAATVVKYTTNMSLHQQS